MAKIVRYNGGGATGSDNSISAELVAQLLVTGKEYEVVSRKHRGYMTYYTLKGVNGYFPYLWFDDVVSETPAYMALAHTVPIVGEALVCTKFEFVGGLPMLGASRTITAKEVMLIGSSIYRIVANDGIYIVKVG